MKKGVDSKGEVMHI